MPSSEELKRRADLRALRKQNQQSAVEKAQSEAAALSAQSEQQTTQRAQAEAKASEEGKSINVRKLEKTPAQRVKEKQEAKAATKRAAEIQAERDVRKTPSEVDFKKVDEEALPGSSLSLHQLNAIAEKSDRELRDEGKAIASAAARGAYETYLGKVAGKRSKHSHMRAQIAAGEQVIAARQAQQDAS